MLAAEEILERAKYCYLVFFQLSHLRDRDPAKPLQYLQILQNSSLKLHEDEFIVKTMEEEIRMGNPDNGLTYLISLYEGFTHAYCEVLEKDLTEIRDAIPKEFLQKLAAEMGGRF